MRRFAHPGLVLALLMMCAATAWPQVPGAASETQPLNAPLPDIPTLLHDVEKHEDASETAERDYLYTVTATKQELESHGKTKSIATTVSDSLTLRGIRVNRVVSHNGAALNADQQKKENERIDKEVEKGQERLRKAQEKGKDVDSNGEDEVTASRFLQLGKFTNPRRELRNGRSTIAVDFAGDPTSKAQTTFEAVIRNFAGTVWIDEQDRAIYRIEGHSVAEFRKAAGLIADLKKGTTVTVQFTKVNEEVWLPSNMEAQGSLHYLLFFGFAGSIHVSYSNYRKFQTNSIVLPTPDSGQTAAPGQEQTAPQPPMSQPAPRPGSH